MKNSTPLFLALLWQLALEIFSNALLWRPSENLLFSGKIEIVSSFSVLCYQYVKYRTIMLLNVNIAESWCPDFSLLGQGLRRLRIPRDFAW